MNVDELAAKYGLTNEWIEESAAAYERGDYPHEDGQVYSLSLIHISLQRQRPHFL